MNYRKSAKIYLLALLIFFAANFLVWKFFTEQILTNHLGSGGDLARLGYVASVKQPRRVVVDLPHKHIEYKNYTGQPIDLITIGDSFSNGGGEGKNSYYQDYIATFNNFNVLNLQINDTAKRGPIETAIYLVNSGLVDKIQPRYLLIQSVERFCFLRFSGEIDFKKHDNIHDLDKYFRVHADLLNYLPEVFFVNDGNMKFLYYKFLYLFSDSPTGNVVVKKISRPLFNTTGDDKLVFYRDDVKNIHKLNSHSIGALNDNMNRLADLLEKKNIKLYFMPSVDKYNLYSEFIINNPYPHSVFFEELQKLPKRYTFINTKKILIDAVRRGEKDVYYADDTHWSWRASELIFKTVRFNSKP